MDMKILSITPRVEAQGNGFEAFIIYLRAQARGNGYKALIIYPRVQARGNGYEDPIIYSRAKAQGNRYEDPIICPWLQPGDIKKKPPLMEQLLFYTVVKERLDFLKLCR